MRTKMCFAALSLFIVVGCSANGSAADPKSQVTKIRSDLYQCEGCEGALEADVSKLTGDTRISRREEPGEPMRIDGVVYATDGKTPVSGVVIYAYQTNAEGLYVGGTPETEASKRHGRLRAWVKTDANGHYRFDTIKPAPYPNDTIPAHVHFTILESGKPPYWIDDIVFDGEFGVTAKYRRSMTNKGGNGITKIVRNSNGIWIIKRDIVLERHPQ